MWACSSHTAWVAGGTPPAFVERYEPPVEDDDDEEGVAGGTPPAFVERPTWAVLVSGP